MKKKKGATITVMGDCVIVRRANRKVRYHYPAQMSGASCRRMLDLLEKCEQGSWANRFLWKGGHEMKEQRAQAAARIEAKREIAFDMSDALATLKATNAHAQIARDYGKRAIMAQVAMTLLADISSDALKGNFRQIKAGNETIDEVLGLYASASETFGDLIERYMPAILTYDELMTVCGESFIDIEIKATCPV